MEKLRICRKCGKKKALSEFGQYKSARDRKYVRRFSCLDCERKRAREYWNKHSMGRQKNKLRFHYGMSVEEYTAKLLKQNGVCAICGKPETRITKGTLNSLCVDHSHKTNLIRGLLCSKCNSMLGFVDEDVKVLQSAIRYLKSYQK